MSGRGGGIRTSQAVLSLGTSPGNPGDILHNLVGTLAGTCSPERSAPASQDRTALRTDHSGPALHAGLLSPPLLPSRQDEQRSISGIQITSFAGRNRRKWKCTPSGLFNFGSGTFGMHGGMPRSAERLGAGSFVGRFAGNRTLMPSCRAPAGEGTHSQPNGRARVATAAKSRNVMWMDVDAGVDDAQGTTLRAAVVYCELLGRSRSVGRQHRRCPTQGSSWRWSPRPRTCLVSASSMATWCAPHHLLLD